MSYTKIYVPPRNVEDRTPVVETMESAPEPVSVEHAQDWPLKVSPRDYLERYPDGPHAEAARGLVNPETEE